jgi:hypothetical protein
MEACYGGTDVMERFCAVARGKDINSLFGCNGYVTAVALAKADGFILVWGSLTGIISVHLFRSHGAPGSPLNQGDWCIYADNMRAVN